MKSVVFVSQAQDAENNVNIDGIGRRHEEASVHYSVRTLEFKLK
jgi:hypothetical protein